MKHTLRFCKGGVDIGFELPKIDFTGNAFVPTTAVVPLKQHCGEEARPIVFTGDLVKEGQVIARGPVPVHAPIPGKVTGLRRVPLPDGTLGDAIVIQLAGAFDITGRKVAAHDWKRSTTQDLSRLLEDKGVVDSFEEPKPLAEALKLSRTAAAPALICRLFDQDPTAPIESRVLAEYPERVWNGMALVASAMRAGRVAVIVEEGSPVSPPPGIVPKDLFGDVPVSFVVTRRRYPSGSKTRIQRLLTERVPDLSLEGALYLDSVTALAAYDAVVRNVPSISVLLLVLGNAITRPQLLRVKTGTLIGDVIDECGGFKTAPERILVNGLMRGTALFDLDTPVTGYTRSLYVMDRDSCPSYTVRDCVHCGSCLAVCPAALDPARTVFAIRRGDLGERVLRSINACEGCGCCSVVCPSRIPLHHEITGGRRLLPEDLSHER